MSIIKKTACYIFLVLTFLWFNNSSAFVLNNYATTDLILNQCPARIAAEAIPEAATSAPTTLQQLKSTSDAWWELWLPPETADLDLAAEIEGEATGYGYFGEELRSIDANDIEGWKSRMRAWLSTLESLEYYATERQFCLLGNTGLEWGYYQEKQIKKGGEVYRNHKGRYSLTWILTSKGWRIFSYHRSAIPE